MQSVHSSVPLKAVQCRQVPKSLTLMAPIHRARVAGADAALLIAAVLPNKDLTYLTKAARKVRTQAHPHASIWAVHCWGHLGAYRANQACHEQPAASPWCRSAAWLAKHSDMRTRRAAFRRIMQLGAGQHGPGRAAQPCSRRIVQLRAWGQHQACSCA